MFDKISELAIQISCKIDLSDLQTRLKKVFPNALIRVEEGYDSSEPPVSYEGDGDFIQISDKVFEIVNQVGKNEI